MKKIQKTAEARSSLKGSKEKPAGTPKKSLSDLDKAIIRELTGTLPVNSQPFTPMARRLGITQRELLRIIKQFKEDGSIRRFGATIRHRNSGFSANAMVVWNVPEEKIDQAGRAMAAFKEVTHCYHRRPQRDWKYNLFTMVHGASEEECRQTAEKIARITALTDYQLLFSRKELKKTTMRYFHE
jgi:DNA-binding Lrp family transcriptional regulator